MAADGSAAPTYRGQIRAPGQDAAPGGVTLAEAAAVISRNGDPPRTVAYRDMALLAIADGVILVATGAGPHDERWLLEKFGAATGPLVAALRERRLRQRLGDAFVQLPAKEPVELVEYADDGPAAAAGPAPGGADARPIAQLAIDAWGATLAPLDERLPLRRVRRAEIRRVDLLPQVGGVEVSTDGGRFRLLRLGAAAARHRSRLQDLPAAAHRDAAAIVAAVAPDISSSAAGRAAAALVDGRPAAPVDLGEAWDALERAVLREPVFAASYRALRERAGGSRAPRWLAIAPERPGVPDSYRAWFLVALPGNLVALELVSEGAHATYCFRAAPRATYAGGADPAGIDAAAATHAVARISAALVDARFLREPMALPDERLATAEAVRYRLALRAIPSLAAARADFVARLIHRTEAGWTAALDELIAWHASCRDDAAIWPGRQAQEAAAAAGQTGVE
jgi:hypothetical protein